MRKWQNGKMAKCYVREHVQFLQVSLLRSNRKSREVGWVASHLLGTQETDMDIRTMIEKKANPMHGNPRGLRPCLLPHQLEPWKLFGRYARLPDTRDASGAYEGSSPPLPRFGLADNRKGRRETSRRKSRTS